MLLVIRMTPPLTPLILNFGVHFWMGGGGRTVTLLIAGPSINMTAINKTFNLLFFLVFLGIFWTGFHGLRGELGKVIWSVLPVDYEQKSKHSMMSWNLTSRKFPTETECEVWKLLPCSFTNQSKKNSDSVAHVRRITKPHFRK